VWVSLSVFALFSLLLLQFYKIQIVEGEKWTRVALSQHQMVLIEPFKRGLFYSNTSIREGHPVADQPFVIDVPKFHLYADPKGIPAECKKEVQEALIHLLGLQEKDKEKLGAQLIKKSRSRKLVMWLGHEHKERITRWWMPYAKSKKIARNALFFVQDYKRSYPFGSLLGTVLHTVRDDKEGFSKEAIPTGGLELIFNKQLQGKVGKRLLMRSPRHPLDMGKILSYPEDGADVYLTVNHHLQAIAEEEIGKAVKSANAKGGWAVMMEPRTGEILALAQYPCFDPTNYRRYFNDSKLREDTKVKAVTDPFEPGSTMKALTMAICLKVNSDFKKLGKPPLFSPEEKMAVSNGQFPGRSKPIKDTRLHHNLNMYLALQKSSNIYMARVIQKAIGILGEKWYHDTLQEVFGFGMKTGIELPSESAGFLPSFGKTYANGALQWSVPTPFSLSFGYNLLVNSIQMVRAYAIIANGGYDVKPTLVRKIVKTHRDGTHEILLDNTKEERVQSFKRLMDEEVARHIADTIKLTTKPGGTAPKADIYGYTEGGKTSTTEKIVNGTYCKKEHISTFIGFAPASNPRFVLMIAIDEPEYKFVPGVGKNQMGGNCAAPAFREIGTRTLQYLGVEPDDPYGYPPGDPRSNPEKADSVKRAKALKELYAEWNQ
jgi:cell division protein FtsI (penicillin-binding protein 3)